MVKSKLAKSVLDAGWGQFVRFLKYKAEEAGTKVVEVDPAYTSQICPQCWAVKKKELRERIHACGCGLVLDRDSASARVILALAASVSGGVCGGLASALAGLSSKSKSAQRSRKARF